MSSILILVYVSDYNNINTSAILMNVKLITDDDVINILAYKKHSPCSKNGKTM